MAGILDMLTGGGDPWAGKRQVTPQMQQQQQPPQVQAPQQQGGGMGDFLSAIAPAIAMLDPRNQQLGASLMQMNMGRQQKREQKQQQNQTVSWLQKQGVGTEEATIIASDPDALRAWWKQAATGNQPDWEITEIFNDEGQKIKAMVDKKTGKWNPIGGAEDKSKSGGVEYGLSPQTGVDAQGNPVLIQLGKNGTSIKTPLPEGVSLSKEPIKLDAGTHFVLLDPITRQPVGQIPKDLAGAESQKAVGEAQGKALAAASGDIAAGEEAISLMDNILADPYRERGTGMSSLGNRVPGTGGYDFQKKVDQAKSGAFLTAIQQMRGLGALSNAEGETATKAVTRMDTALSEEGFIEAANEYKRIIAKGMERARQRTIGQPSPEGSIAAPSSPGSGQQQNRLRFNPQTGELE